MKSLFKIFLLLLILIITIASASDTCRYCAQLQTLADCAECHKSCRWEIADSNQGQLAPESTLKGEYRYRNGKCREASLP
jgi:hypothetical protein